MSLQKCIIYDLLFHHSGNDNDNNNNNNDSKGQKDVHINEDLNLILVFARIFVFHHNWLKAVKMMMLLERKTAAKINLKITFCSSTTCLM